MASTLLVIGDAGAPNSADTALQSRLTGLGHSVTLASDGDGDLSSGKALVVIGPSCSSAQLGATYNTSAAPVLLLEDGVFTDMRLASGNAGSSGNNQTFVREHSEATGHPIHSGLTFNLAIFTTSQNLRRVLDADMVASATLLTKIDSSDLKCVSFAIESGAALTSGTAPARRGGYLINDAHIAALSADGWDYFDRMVAWAIGSGGDTYTGTLSSSVPLVTATLTGIVTASSASGTVSASTPRATSSLAGTVTPPTYSGTLNADIPPTRSTITGTVSAPAGAATLSATLPRVTGTLSGTVAAPTWTGGIDGQLAPITGTILGAVTGPAFIGTLDGTLPGVTGATSGSATVPTGSGTLTAVLPRTTASLVGVVQVDDDLVPASARILTTAVRAPTARATSVRANSASGTLRTNTAQGRLR